mgnify:CR=1 FL=1
MSCLLSLLLSLKLNFVFELNDYFYVTTMVVGGLSTFSAVIMSGQKSEDIVKEQIGVVLEFTFYDFLEWRDLLPMVLVPLVRTQPWKQSHLYNIYGDNEEAL